MLPTFIIGLREGLEAVLIVGIIAAYLKRNDIARWPMWCGVVLAVLISIGVGVALQVVEQALPQAQQEGMESIIGLIAVVFVTGMVVWMGKNAGGLRSEIEGSASAAAGKGTAWALAGMAFLAVVKEGFETSVFLLATLNASTSAGPAAWGAFFGIVVACIVGYLLYTGGARLNLGKFFKISGVFLVFVAAGLLLSAFRTAHGAGWVNIGQQHTVDLSWLSPIGSVRSALITGVLGIPADPRVIEVLAWFCYLVPVLAIAVWPRRWRLSPTGAPRFKAALAGACALAALVLVVAVPSGQPNVPATATLVAGKGHRSQPGDQLGPITASVTVAGDAASLQVHDGGHVQTISFPSTSRTRTLHQGVNTSRWTTTVKDAAEDRPTTLTIDDLVATFGRVPIGISTVQDPGPYHAAWSTIAQSSVWLAHGGILDVQRVDHITLTLTGGGLSQPRTLTLTEPYWSVAAKDVVTTSSAISAAEQRAKDRTLWRQWLPLALAVTALGLLLTAWRERRQLRGMAAQPPTPSTPARGDESRHVGEAPQPPRSTVHASP